MNTIRFKNIAKIMLIPGRADGAEGMFVFDTGAMQTSLNRKYFPDFEGKTAEVAIFDSSMAEAAAAEVTLREFSVGSVAAHDFPAMLFDMSYVENALRAVDSEVCIYGSVGMDFFGGAPILIDYERSEITVDPDIDVSGAEKIPLNVGALPVFSVEIGGEPHNFVLDTGANTCLMSGELADKITVSPIEDSPGVYTVQKILVGSHEYRNVEAVFTDISRIRAKFAADGVIGGQILSGQRSVIDFKNGALYLF